MNASACFATKMVRSNFRKLVIPTNCVHTNEYTYINIVENFWGFLGIIVKYVGKKKWNAAPKKDGKHRIRIVR